MVHTKIFIRKFIEKLKNIKLSQYAISNKIYELCKLILNFQGSNNNYLDISDFINYFKIKHPNFGDEQNDSHEFCVVLLDDISNELNENINKMKYNELSYNFAYNKILTEKEFNENFKLKENSIITDIFYSEIVSKFTCTCNYITYSFQKLLDFSLLIPDNLDIMSIEDLIEYYFKSDVVEFKYLCPNCKRKCDHSKEIKLVSLPKILIISLQRINWALKIKNNAEIRFNEKLNLSKYVDNDFLNKNEGIYNLFALINHEGEISFGHYYSLIKMYQNDWYEFNDLLVKKYDNNFQMLFRK